MMGRQPGAKPHYDGPAGTGAGGSRPLNNYIHPPKPAHDCQHQSARASAFSGGLRRLRGRANLANKKMYQMRSSTMSKPISKRRLIVALSIITSLSMALPLQAIAEDIFDLIPGTAVLLDQSSGSGGSGGGTSSRTNIFSPATYADYKRF